MSPDWPKRSTPNGTIGLPATAPSHDNVAGWKSPTVTSAAPGRSRISSRSATPVSPRVRATSQSRCRRSGEVIANRPAPGMSSAAAPAATWERSRRSCGRVNRRAARHLAEHLARAGGTELPGLSVNALASGRDAGVAVNRDSRFRDAARPALGDRRGGERMGLRHGGFMQRTYATRKPLMRQARSSVASFSQGS
jgi:hypothetical protein